MTKKYQKEIEKCRICGAKASLKCQKTLESQPIKYYQCQNCHFLQAEKFDVSKVYKEYLGKSDFGWKQRNKEMLKIIIRLMETSLLKGLDKGAKLLDFGCGSGELVKQLRLKGYNAYGYDPFKLLFSKLSSFKKGEIKLVTCIEVLEHLWNPFEFFQLIDKILSPCGYVLISTGIYRPNKDNCDWWYLNPKAGHISLFSQKAFNIFLKRTKFHIALKISDTTYLIRKNSNIFSDSLDFIRKIISSIKVFFEKFSKLI